MLRFGSNITTVLNTVLSSSRAEFSTTGRLQELRNLSRVLVVDNSTLASQAESRGKAARVIHVYTRSGIGRLGDKVLVAVAGQKKQAYIVGVRKKQRANIPRFDANMVVLVEENGTPVGNRVTAPLPTILRRKGGDFTKILAITSRFV